jgi:hypothetical protein
MAKKPQTRQERLARALRENLKRRKGDLRSRPAEAKASSAAPPPDGRPNTAGKEH